MQDLIIYTLFTGHVLLLSVIIMRVSPFFAALAAKVPGRNHSIEGVRGFLALSVFMHHAIKDYYTRETGIAGYAPSLLYSLLGSLGVTLFFMISGFLFWQKAIEHRIPRNPLRFYYARFMRLAPAYLFSVTCVVAAALAFRAGYSLDNLKDEDISAVLQFRGVQSLDFINSAYWTLPFEWGFYLILPALALFRHRYWSLLPLTAFLLTMKYYDGDELIYDFLCGALVAELVHKYDLRKMLSLPICGVASICALSLVINRYNDNYAYNPQASGLLMFVVLCIACGNSFCGPLHTRPALLLGTISYSMYLLHMVVIYVVSEVVFAHVATSSVNENAYCLCIMPIMSALVVALSLFSYRYCEHPYLVRTISRGGFLVKKSEPCPAV